MNGLKNYDDWKLETPEDERWRYGDRDEPQDELPTELDLAYGDLDAALALIREMQFVLKVADGVLTQLGATDEYAIIQIIRAAVAKAEVAS